MNTGFTKEKNGTWSINTTVKINDEYKHFYKRGYATLMEAKADYIRAEQEFIAKNTQHHKVMLFNELLEQYAAWRKNSIVITTWDSESYVLKKYMEEPFGKQLISNVFAREVMLEWYNNVSSNMKLSERRRNKIIATMKDIIKFAYNNLYIDPQAFQVCDTAIIKIKASKKEIKDKGVWSDIDEMNFLNACKENKVDYLMFRMFLLTGTRIGEFLGIQVNCLDFVRNRVEIKQQVIDTRSVGKAYLTDQLKTHESYRKILLPESFMNELKDYIIQTDLDSDDFLFHSFSVKRPISRNTFRRKLKEYCDKAGINYVNPHNIRHLQATKLARACNTGNVMELEAAAKRLGHSTSVFLDTYAKHSTEDTEEMLLKKMLN